MRAKELANLLAKTIPAKLPVLVKGAPGVGKSDVVLQAASMAAADVVLMHPVVSDPTDYKGMPAVLLGKPGQKPRAEFLPFGDLHELVEAKRLTVCFLDDLGQAPAVVQAACMQLILARRVNGHKVSDHVVFVAATNRREDRAGVTGILEPVKSRFTTIVELEPHVDDWCEWALANDVAPELVAFLRFRPTLLMAAGAPTNDIVNRPCPRTVANMGKLYGLGITDVETLGGAVGPGFAAEFVGFLRVWQALPSIDAILMNPATAQVPGDGEPAALFAVATALATRVNPKNAGRAMTYAARLPGEFGVLCVRDMLRHCPQAANCREYIAWAVDHQDELL